MVYCLYPKPLAGVPAARSSKYGLTSVPKSNLQRRFTVKNQLIMTRMEKFLDGKAFSRLKFLYVSSIMVNSKFRLNTVVYDIVVPYISLKR